MPAVTVRNIPEETHRALEARAERNGKSTEAEIRAILEEAVRPVQRVRVGTELAKFGKRIHHELRTDRDPRPIEPAVFE